MADNKSFWGTEPNGIMGAIDPDTPVPHRDPSPASDDDSQIALDSSLLSLDDSEHQIDLSSWPGASKIPAPPVQPQADDTTDSAQNRTRIDPYAGKEVYLHIEGGQEVFYRGAYVTRIPLQGDPLLVGRRDVMAGHYPDIDLALYWKQDRCLSRKHLRIYRDVHGNYFVEDLCCNNATFLNDMDHPLNKQRAELHPGDRIFVSMSIVIDFCVF